MASESSENSPSKPPSEPPPIFSPPPIPARPPRSNEKTPTNSMNFSENLPKPHGSRHKDVHDLENEQDIEDEISAQMTASYSEISFNSGGESPISDCDTAVSLGLDQPLTIPDLPDHIKQRPASLQYDNPQTETTTYTKHTGSNDLSGTIHVDGNMTYFVAEDLEYKIKLSSPIAKKNVLLRIMEPKELEEQKKLDEILKTFVIISFSDEDKKPSSFPAGTSRSGTPSNLYRQILVPQFQQIDANILSDLECEAQRMATSIDSLTENLGGILHSMSSITADNVDIYKDAVSKMSDAMDSNIKGMYTIIAKAEEVSHIMKNVQYHAERIKEIKRLVDLFESNL